MTNSYCTQNIWKIVWKPRRHCTILLLVTFDVQSLSITHEGAFTLPVIASQRWLVIGSAKIPPPTKRFINKMNSVKTGGVLGLYGLFNGPHCHKWLKMPLQFRDHQLSHRKILYFAFAHELEKQKLKQYLRFKTCLFEAYLSTDYTEKKMLFHCWWIVFFTFVHYI